jgi:hypothetical protein
MSARDRTSTQDDNAGGGGTDDGFLSRWSRRKRENAAKENAAKENAAKEIAAKEIATEPAAVEPDVADEQADTPATDAETANAEAEPLVEPPSLDLIDKDFDLAHWLKQNVPESWKLAALRKTWETDPFIHGYLNPARDYALDWNVPGGAPGYGPLTESDDVQAMVARVFGAEPAAAPNAGAINAGDLRRSDNTGSPDQSDTATQHRIGPVGENATERTIETTLPVLQPVRLGPNPPESAATLDAASQQSPQPAKDDAPSFVRTRRRGGGAIPV